ncbi:MAG: glycosyltransferase [Bacteroidetes bacterium]|nr:glycosyltransferase [Bacteroidota bacterium]
METLTTITQIIGTTLFIWAALATSYMFMYSFFGLLFTQKTMRNRISDLSAPRIAVIIPAYKEDNVIIKTAESALRQSYPVGKYQVTVVADGLQRSTLYKLKNLPLHVLEVQFENSTKAKALNAALNNLSDNFDMVVILDSDNIIRPDFLTKMGEAYLQGHRAIQGHRTAKNFNTPYALLDAISEEINNHIFCKGQQYLGMSSRLTGSGMGFEYLLFKQLMSEIDAVGGFDKELELKLIAAEAKIHYVPSAIVYDEKVSKSEVMVKQRSRWISSQIHYMKKYVPSGIIRLVKNRDVDYFNKSIQLLIPPRMFMILIVLIGIGLSLFSKESMMLYNWIILCITYMMAFILAFPKKFIGRQLFQLGIAVPNALFHLVSSIPSMFHANKKFIHTPHES